MTTDRADDTEEDLISTHLRDETLYQALCRSARLYGRNHVVSRTTKDAGLTYRTLLQSSFALGRYFRRYLKNDINIGILMPTAPISVAVFYGVQASRHVPAMLNYTAGGHAIIQACDAAHITTIVTARRFITEADLSALIEALPDSITVLYLEDIKPALIVGDKALAWLHGLGLYPSPAHKNPDDTAVILFTSGSEGAPKAVALSHKNLLANYYQIKARIDFSPRDVFFNCLPMFHSFGLLGSVILPVMGGVTCFLHTNPLQYRVVPELIRTAGATIMFSTDTFLSGYARHATADDFKSMRCIFAGAEKLKESTRLLYAERFNVPIMQGYGVTETSPVIAVNSATHHKPETVGRLMAHMEYRLEPVDGITNGGRLFVRGPNVMRGYIGQPLTDGWHDTGDIVHMDVHRFITILGRARRFAKMAGEMVSLSLTEQMAGYASPDHIHGAIPHSDNKRGEEIILYTTDRNLTREMLQEHAKEKQITALAIPKTIHHLDTLPLLGSGKIDYVALAALTRDQHTV